MILENGAGNGKKLKVNGRNEACVFSVQESEAQAAAENGDAYNINTGDITGITGTTSLLYFKNDEEQDMVVEAIALGVRGATITDMASVFVVKNPDAGTIISNATAVDMNQNRNFGSSKVLKDTSVAYKGANGYTATGGQDSVQLYTGNNGRLFATINIELPRGSSLAIRLEGLTGGTAYAALVMHLKDSERG